MASSDMSARDGRGEWQPDVLPKPGALFQWPPKFLPLLDFIFGHEGLLWSVNAVYLALAIVSWLFLTPSMERMMSFSFDWIALIFARNAGLLTVIAGGLHIRLYIRKRQGTRYKYSDKWLSTKNKKFLFRNQTTDNIFWSLVSGCTIWTAYEAIMLWVYANRFIPFVDFRDRPVYLIVLMLGTLLFRHFHFYAIHRASHWKPLYRISHYLHHKNINIGPWSGLSMHPIEHILYFSGVLIHLIVPSHPVHAIFHLMHAGLAPASGHSGFHGYVIKSGDNAGEARSVNVGDYFHYLHHRYFTVNFGNTGIPIDLWFGSFHDGSSEAQAAMNERRKGEKLGRD